MIYGIRVPVHQFLCLKVGRLQGGRLNLALLNLTTHDVDGILRHDDEVLAGLIDLLNVARILLRVLHKHLLTCLGILTKECRASRRLNKIIQLDRHILLDRQLRGVHEGRGGR